MDTISFPIRTRRGRPKVADPANPPILLSLQPQPLSTHVLHVGSDYTAINREWDKAEIGRCRLCPRCYSTDGRSCLVGIGKYVSPEDAPLFDGSRLAEAARTKTRDFG